jgi:hypothetical protein
MAARDESGGLADPDGKSGTGWVSSLIVFGGGAVVLIAIVSLFIWSTNSSKRENDALEKLLNDRYVESIDVDESVDGTGSSHLISIDGVTRHDCRNDDGYLKCSKEPTPTLSK